MFTHKKKHKSLRQTFAFVLSLAMILSNLSVVPVQAETVSGGDAVTQTTSGNDGGTVSGNEGGAGSAESGGKVYELLPTENTTAFAKQTKADYDTEKAGTDEYFTLHFSAKTEIKTNTKSFDDGYTSVGRINFNSKPSFDDSGNAKDAVSFTTSRAAEVKVWWGAGDADRQMAIFDDEGNIVVQTNETIEKDGLNVATLSLTEAGTYYLGGTPKKNYIYKVEVTESGSAAAVTEVAATITVKDTNGLLGSNNIVFTNAADETDVHNFSANGGTATLKANAIYNLSVADESLRVTVDGETSVKTGKEAVSYEVLVESSALTADVTVNDPDDLLGDATLSLTHGETTETVANGSKITLENGAEYTLECSSKRITAKIGGETGFTAGSSTTAIVIDIASNVVETKVVFDGAEQLAATDTLTLTNEADATEVLTLKDGEKVELIIGETYALACSNADLIVGIDEKQRYTASADVTEITVTIKGDDGNYVIDITGGLKAGVAYKGGISVLEDMPYKDSEKGTVGGVEYVGAVAGTNNPKTSGSNSKGTVPDSGSALILTAEEDGRLKIVAKVNSGKAVYLVEKDSTEEAWSWENSGSSSAYEAFTFQVEKGKTYYFYGNGTKVPMLRINVDYRTSIPWDEIAEPVLNTPTVDAENGTITVPFEAEVGGIFADAIEISMYKDGEAVATETYAEETTAASVKFTPSESGDYTFKAALKRTNEEDKLSNETEAVAFVLPMAEPSINGVANKGAGTVRVTWQEVAEAEKYNVYVNGELKSTVTEAFCTIEGLTVGTEYEFAVEAVGNNDVSEKATMKQTVTENAEYTWQFVRYGSSTSTDEKNCGYSGSIETNDLSVWCLNGKGKLVPASTDGISYYYTMVDPETENFTFSADITVEEWSYSNGQEGFGLMVADTIGEDGNTGAVWNNSYMALVSKVEYYWDSENQKASDSGTKYTMRLGVGAQEKKGVTPETIAAGNPVDYFSSSMVTLDYEAAQKDLASDVSYNMVANCQNASALAEKATDFDELSTKFHFEIQRNNTGYFITYTDEAGNSTTQKYWHGDDGDELTKIDPNNIYVGIFAARNAKIKVENVSLVPINPADDAPAEPRPIDVVTTNVGMESAKIANSEDYTLVYYGNVDGTLTIEGPNGVVVDAVKVTAETKHRQATKLTKGTNKFKVTFVPDADYKPGKYEVMSSYDTVSFDFNVEYKTNAGDVIYISPNGKPTGAGTKNDPMDIYTAVKYPAPGQMLLLMEGTYNLSKTVTVDRGIDGTADKMIYLIVDPEAKSRPVLDFGGNCAGMVFAGDYWYIQGFDVTDSESGEKGIQISGNNNTIDRVNTYRNGNTGIQISRYKGTDKFDDWPADNLVLNCTSYLNADPGYEDADGFAAKLTIGEGNVFDGCIAAYNADDGWDMFAKVQTGPIGKVVVKNSIAFKNGYDIDENGNEINAGNGNGFKMGGESITGYHELRNSIAFENRAKGIDSNSCPDIQVYNSTSYNNASYNVAYYTNDAKNTDFFGEGIISYKNNGNTVAEQFKFKGTQDQSKVYGDSNYYYDGAKSVNQSGEQVGENWFVSTDTATAIGSGKARSIGAIGRNADGTINMNGYLELTSNAPADSGARMTGTPSAVIEVPVSENPDNDSDDDDNDKSDSSSQPAATPAPTTPVVTSPKTADSNAWLPVVAMMSIFGACFVAVQRKQKREE